MPEKRVHLKGNLEGLEVAMDNNRRVIRVTSNGQTIICEQTPFGLICEPFNTGGSAGGHGPALQLRVTDRRLFARMLPEGASDSQRAARKGFQRHIA